MERRFNHCWIVVAGLMLCQLGCGSGKTPTYAAGGKVKLGDGSPLPIGFVIFRSLDDPQHPSARASITASGDFELSTFVPGDGAVIGKHKALVSTPEPGGRPGFTSPNTVRLDPRFSDFDTSGLEFTVTNKPAQNRFEIVVTKSK